MFQAERLKILLSDQKQRGMIDGGTGGRVVSTIKHGNLRHGISRPVDAEHLFTPAGRAFEDANMPALHHIESRARLALAEKDFSRRAMPRDGALGKKAQFLKGKPRKNRNLRQSFTVIGGWVGHAGHCSVGLFAGRVAGLLEESARYSTRLSRVPA